MSRTRWLAARLLGAVVRRHHADEWGIAMLHELDAVEGDWAAVRWALGGTVALVRRDVAKHATGVLVVAAFALWRRRRSTAMGFALSAVLLVAHVCL